MIIKNENLMQSMKGKPCICCGKTWVSHGHHHLKRKMGGGSRLDIIENLSPICDVPCHYWLHYDKKKFIEVYGEDLYRFLTTLKDNLTIMDIERIYRHENN